MGLALFSGFHLDFNQ